MNTNPCDYVNMSGAISEALRRRGATEDAVDAGFGSGLESHSILGKPVIAAGAPSGGRKGGRPKGSKNKVQKAKAEVEGGKKKRGRPKAAKKEGASKTTKKGGERKVNPWMVHVKKFKSEHPDMKYSEVLKQAKASYKSK